MAVMCTAEDKLGTPRVADTEEVAAVDDRCGSGISGNSSCLF